MKGIRFYEEFENKRKGVSAGNVTAVILDDRGQPQRNGDGTYTCIGAVFHTPNSGVATTACSPEWLAENCKRVPEKRAREVHPLLFSAALDRD